MLNQQRGDRVSRGAGLFPKNALLFKIAHLFRFLKSFHVLPLKV
jgi:hypothetical protein